MTKSVKGFEVLTEVISPENVQDMAELIALKETKALTAYSGCFILKIHRKLICDIAHRGDLGHVLSDSYELVQAVALFLCEHFGKHLDDIYKITRKGKKVTLKIQCYRIISRIICAKYRRLYSDLSAENLYPNLEPRAEIELNDSKDYTAADEMVAKMMLTETHKEILNYRMSGASLREIGRHLGKCTGTIFDLLSTIRRRYFKYILNI